MLVRFNTLIGHWCISDQ